MTKPGLLDVVRLNCDLSELGLRRGQVGTIVYCYPDGTYEVEFSDDEGETQALASLSPAQVEIVWKAPLRSINLP